ncbi:MAG: class I SAM-dependent methyltransferase [Deltaproteobacteria bacterium]|nr:class I SAM-dependent methyltransferase [Deltaproteobacteria bacterium]
MSFWRPFGEQGPSFGDLAQQAWSSTDHGYDLLAARFDATPFRTPDDVVSNALSGLGPDRFAKGLDVCCGTGAGLVRLQEHCVDVVGVDRSAGMLREAALKVPAAVLVQGDALELPFDQVFDVACSFGAFGHILVDDEARFVRSVHRALVPGGRFIFVTAEPPPFFSRRHVVARAFNATLRVRNLVKSPPFVMYYLTFLLPRARAMLEDAGFEVRVHPLGLPGRDELGTGRYVVVDARKR